MAHRGALTTLIAGLLLSWSVHASPFKPFINGGEDVKKDEPIAATTVAIGGSHGMHCSGTIIAKDLILTAAHCLKDVEVTKIFFGVNVDRPQTVKTVEGYVHHQDYNRWRRRDPNDIGLVHFEGGLPRGFELAEIVDADFILRQDGNITLAGYGMDRQDEIGRLKKVALQIEDPNFGDKEIIIDQDTRDGACNGDSGGPAYVPVEGENHVVGVASRVGNKECGRHAIYSKPHAYLDWLADKAKQLRNESSYSGVHIAAGE